MNLLLKHFAICIFFCLFLFSNYLLLGQQVTVSGKIMDEFGKAISGAIVEVVETGNGMTTLDNGDFFISALPSQTIRVSSMGYQTVTQQVGSSRNINFTLVVQSQDLGEVVVTGYTNQTKESITGGVSVVNVGDIEDMPDANVLNAIQGRTTGIQIGKVGGPGGSNIVRIRGFSNISTADPLYIIDGLPTQDGDVFNAINPSDIASIQVLKDASAAAIYGSRANNGVIIITTKAGSGKGQEGKTVFGVSYYVGIQTPRENTFPNFLSPQEEANYLWDREKNAGKEPQSALYGNGVDPVIPVYLTKEGGVSAANLDDYRFEVGAGNNPIRFANQQGTEWFNEIFKPSLVQNVDFNAGKTSEKSKFYFSTNYHTNEGILQHTSFNRFTLRANTSFKVAKFLTLGENMMMSYFENKGDSRFQDEGGAVNMAFRVKPIIPVYDIRNNFAGTRGGGLGNAYNPLANLNRDKYDTRRNLVVLGNVFAELNLFDGLIFKSVANFNLRSISRSDYAFKRLEDQEQFSVNSYTEGDYFSLEQTYTNFLNYDKKFGGKHHVAALLGVEFISRKSRSFTATRTNFDLEDPDFMFLSSGGAANQKNSGEGSEVALFSIFSKLDYSYADKYFFTGVLRYDETSRFLGNNRSKVFPSIGLAWVISKEKFMQNNRIFDNLKLRFAYGETGNQETPVSYPAYTTYGPNATNNNYSVSGSSSQAANGIAPDTDGNPDIRWEIASSVDVAVEMSFLQDRLLFEFDYYVKNTEDMLVQKPRPAVSGLAEDPWVNVGTMQNRGFEILLNFRNSTTSGWKYNVGVTFSRNENEVIKLLDNDNAFISGNDFRGLAPTLIRKGFPVSYFYGYQLDGFYRDQVEVDALEQSNGGVGGFKYKDIDGDGKITTADRTNLGSPHPDFIYGINFAVEYKGLALSLFLEGQQGNEIFNFTKYFTDLFGFPGALSDRVLNFYDPSKDNQGALLPYNSSDLTGQTLASSYYVEDASFLRMRNIQLSYQFPSSFVHKFLKNGAIKVYFQVENAFVITQYSGLDPEVNVPQPDNGVSNTGTASSGNINYTLGVDRGIYPNPTSYIFGVNINF